MNRVEKFKEGRKFRTKCAFVFIFFLILVLTGVCVSDYSINSLMKNQKAIQLVEVINIDKSKLHVSFLNLGIDMDTKYFMKDMEGIIEKFKKIFGF